MKYKITVYFAWWLPLYRWGIVTTVVLTNREPDWQKVEATIQRAVRIKVL